MKCFYICQSKKWIASLFSFNLIFYVHTAFPLFYWNLLKRWHREIKARECGDFAKSLFDDIWFFFFFPKAQKHAVPSRRWSRRSNVVWRCCSDPASSWSVALDSAKRRGDDTSVGGKSRQQSEHEKSLKDRETFTHTHTSLYQNLMIVEQKHVGGKLLTPEQIKGSCSTLNLLSCRTFLMATISWLSMRRAWYTTPNDPLPITCKKRGNRPMSIRSSGGERIQTRAADLSFICVSPGVQITSVTIFVHV